MHVPPKKKNGQMNLDVFIYALRLLIFWEAGNTVISYLYQYSFIEC